MELLKNEISDYGITSFYYYSAILYISAGYYNESIRMLNKILVLNERPIQPEKAMFAKYLLLLAHYELGNMEVLNSINEKMFGPNEFIEPLNLLKQQLPLIQNRKEEKSFFTDFKKQLLRSKNKELLQKYFDFLSWAENKIKR